MTRVAWIWSGSVGLMVVAGLFLGWKLFYSAPDFFHRSQVMVTIGDDTMTVWTATNSAEWAQGLSDTEQETLGADGMLFQFPDKQVRKFWMKDMNYGLDLLWIADGKIMKIDEQVPAGASQGGDIARMDSEPFQVEWVLEVPEGTVSAKKWTVGDVVVLTP